MPFLIYKKPEAKIAIEFFQHHIEYGFKVLREKPELLIERSAIVDRIRQLPGRSTKNGKALLAQGELFRKSEVVNKPKRLRFQPVTEPEQERALSLLRDGLSMRHVSDVTGISWNWMQQHFAKSHQWDLVE